MRFASLGSGSDGNGLLIEAGDTRLLLDCGFSPRETARRLSRLGVAPADISGVVVTHEHADHAGGVFAFARRHALRVWMTHGTLLSLRELDEASDRGLSVELIRGEAGFAICDLALLPFTVPHDAREPVQFA
ncbi:MAG: MBL fold metallo-hydrolase, partial [Betaproteobacteria bacterium]|nr:MBL fold metallo-hydrolase [Betaproteobacteria bacterium]